MNQTFKAFLVALRAHKGQRDKSGKPYILHPMTVARRVSIKEARPAALLHDTVEDTDVTIEWLSEKFDEQTVAAIKLLTKSDEAEYLDYVKAIKGNKIAKAVKLADLSHNMELSRLKNPTEKDYERLEKYKKAKALLLDI